jgi:hypothetical protein
MVNNYRAMMSGDQAHDDLSNYLSSTSAADDGFEAESGVN